MSDNQNTNKNPPITEEESRRRFMARLTDWSEPDSITVIRRGVGGEVIVPEGAVLRNPPPVPTVIGIDEDGNMLMSDGTIVVPER